MAIELIVFGIMIGAAILCYLLGMSFKLPHLFIFGCVLLLGSAAMLWGFDGLITGHYYDVEGVFQSTVISISNIGLQMIAFSCVGIGLISLFVINFGGLKETCAPNPFHY